MKKIVLIIASLVVIGGGVAYFAINSGDDSPTTDTKSSLTASTKTSSTSFKVVKACDALTPEVAKQVLGETAQAGDNSGANRSTDTADVSVSSCTYSAGVPSAQNISTLVSASILARSAKTKVGADANAAQFGPNKAATNQNVTGYGDAAYWNPTYGQFNILKHNNWYILSIGTNNPTTRTLDQAKTYADAIVGNL